MNEPIKLGLDFQFRISVRNLRPKFWFQISVQNFSLEFRSGFSVQIFDSEFESWISIPEQVMVRFSKKYFLTGSMTDQIFK